MPAHDIHNGPARFNQRSLLGALWACVAVSFCFLLFRFYVRLKVFRRLRIEDPFILAAWLMTLINAVVWQRAATSMYLVLAVENGQILMPPPDYLSHVHIQLHSLFAFFLLYYTALWTVKLSLLLLFRDLGNYIRRQMILWYCVLAFTIASYIGCLCMIDYRCLVGKGSLARCHSAYDAYYVPIFLRLATVFDTTTDGLIILVSTNLIRNASIELRKKLALIGVFSLTIFVISVSIIRVVLTTSGPQLDQTWLLLWSGLETAVAIIVACLASFRILYTSSERSRRSTVFEDFSNRAAGFPEDGPGIPLNARVFNSTSIIASECPHQKRQTSTDTFEEAILPMDNAYVQHKYSVLSGPGESYEEIRSRLQTPVGRPQYHRLPSYIRKQDTA